MHSVRVCIDRRQHRACRSTPDATPARMHPMRTQAIAAAQRHSDVSLVAKVTAEVAALEKQLQAVQAQAAQINMRECLLGWPPTDYSQLKQAAAEFEPFHQFWTAASSWQVRRAACKPLCWLAQPAACASKIRRSRCCCDPTGEPQGVAVWCHGGTGRRGGGARCDGHLQAADQAGQGVRVVATGLEWHCITSLVASLMLSSLQTTTMQAFASRGLDQMAANAEALRHEVEEFRAMVPLLQVRRVHARVAAHAAKHACNSGSSEWHSRIDNAAPSFPQALRNPGLRSRHWEQLSRELGQVLQSDASFTLDHALKQGLLAHLGTLTRVAEVASKEYSIEQVCGDDALSKCRTQGLLSLWSRTSADVLCSVAELPQALDKLQREWEGAELAVLPYRETGTCIIKVRPYSLAAALLAGWLV